MFQTLDEAVAFIRHKSVAMVDLKFCDIWGRWRHVTLPAARFTPALIESGVGFDGSSLGLTAVKSGDLVLVPELGTAFLDPFWEAPTLSFLCATLEADTHQPFPHDPRTLAARAEEFLRTSGVGEASLWGPEFEFYLFDGVSYENGMNVAAYRVESREADWKSHELGGG
ncbi:MAG TPA: glutamine synthetase beta-grasp domain-containing protein, partial [Vicinamibacteria bacterium]|nr:glutamine synthetase beta-grasp domain-containing protein [Vicinamibacteria bacterium]